MFSHYLTIQESLASDSMKGMRQDAKALLQAINRVDDGKVTGKNGPIYKNIKIDIKRSAARLIKSGTLENARKVFKNLSEPMVA